MKPELTATATHKDNYETLTIREDRGTETFKFFLRSTNRHTGEVSKYLVRLHGDELIGILRPMLHRNMVYELYA